MEHVPDVHGLNPPAYIRYAEGLVDILTEDLSDPKNQGPNFDPSTFPVADLTGAALQDDDIIAASPEQIETAKAIAEKRWAKLWGLELHELRPDKG